MTIDFSKSFLLWLTKETKVYGRFSIESVCCILDDADNISNEFYLLSGVIASNVFEGDELIKNPPYFFQAIFSNKQYKIFRTYSFQNKNHDDFGQIADRFDNVDFFLPKKQCKWSEDVNEINEMVLKNISINGLVEWRINNKFRVKLEFPIKHINIKLNQNQVETGAIILPNNSSFNHLNINDLNLAYITVRDLKTMEFCCYSDINTSLGICRYYNEIIKTDFSFRIAI